MAARRSTILQALTPPTSCGKYRIFLADFLTPCDCTYCRRSRSGPLRAGSTPPHARGPKHDRKTRERGVRADR